MLMYGNKNNSTRQMQDFMKKKGIVNVSRKFFNLLFKHS